jgi:hypothetical protein
MKPSRFALFFAAMAVSAIGPVTPVSSNERSLSQTREFSAQTRQRPRVRVTPPAAYDYPRPGPYAWPGPGAVRQCVDWYATEYRPSGLVVTPQMRCRWVRG